MTTVTRNDDNQKIYTSPFGRYNQQTSVEESKYEEKRKNGLIGSGESISNKEPDKYMVLLQLPGASCSP